MHQSRRRFLKTVGLAAAGAGCGLPLMASADKAPAGEGAAPAGKRTQLGMVIDVHKCLDDAVRKACAEACHREHNVPRIPDPEEEVKWIWDETYEHLFPDQAHAYTTEALSGNPVLALCNHCASPPCTRVCPTQATWRRKSDGVVMMDMHRCIGCRYCIAACPYGSRSFNWQDPRPHIESIRPEYPTRTMGVVEKCNFCAERLREGRRPACVEAAAATPGGAGALTFGNLSDPDSEVSRLLRENHAVCRKPSLGTQPSVFYLM